MLGIASNQRIDASSIRDMLSAFGYKKGSDEYISYNTWVAAHGTDVFEDKGISVIADMNIYNSRELRKLLDREPQNDACLIGFLYF